MAINLAPRQCQQASLAEEIARIVAEEGVPATSIELEITETTAMADADAAAIVLHQLATYNFSIAIDDFGTGYSSLAYLMAFPVDKLKIDRSFVKDIPGNANDSSLVSAVIKLAKRSEEHTSELQSLMRISYAVFCLKKKIITINHIRTK